MLFAKHVVVPLCTDHNQARMHDRFPGFPETPLVAPFN